MAAADEVVDEIYSQCLGARIRTVGRAVSAIYEEAVRPFNVRFTQMNILVVAAKAGEAKPAEICKTLQLDHSTVSRSVERLAERGWIEVLQDEDGRASPVRVTKQGEALVRRAYPAWRQAQEKVAKMLGTTFAAELLSAANQLNQAD